MLGRSGEDEEARPSREEPGEGYSFDELAKEMANGAISRRKALWLVGAALLSSTPLMFLFPDEAEAGRKKKKGRRKKRHRRSGGGSASGGGSGKLCGPNKICCPSETTCCVSPGSVSCCGGSAPLCSPAGICFSA